MSCFSSLLRRNNQILFSDEPWYQQRINELTAEPWTIFRSRILIALICPLIPFNWQYGQYRLPHANFKLLFYRIMQIYSLTFAHTWNTYVEYTYICCWSLNYELSFFGKRKKNNYGRYCGFKYQLRFWFYLRSLCLCCLNLINKYFKHLLSFSMI